MRTFLALAAAFALASTASAEPVPNPPATQQNVAYFVRGTVDQVGEHGLFIHRVDPRPKVTSTVATGSASVGAGGRVFSSVVDPDKGLRFSSPGIPESFFLIGHPSEKKVAENDLLAAAVTYVGVYHFTDQNGAPRTIHAYKVTEAADPNARTVPPQKPASTNPLDQKPRR